MKKDIFKIFSSNLIKMLVTFVTAFLVPMVLSVDDYGYYKVYTFYAAYIGIFHFGYCDGIYLDYGGRNEDEIETEKISQQFATIFIFSVGLAFIASLWGILRHDFTIVCLGLTVVPNIVYTFYSYVYQATGDFKKYARMLNLSMLFNLLMNTILIFLKVRDYRVYIIVCIIVQLISFLVGTFYFKQSGWIRKSSFSFDVLMKYIKMGILLMLGNFAYTFFIGIDKWFIKFTLGITDFSMYSFASQMLTVVNMFITPISMTLYSHLSRRKDHEFEVKVKRLLVTILMLMPVAIYVIMFIINVFMSKYNRTISLVSVLLITQIFLSLNLTVFVNLYKTYKMQGTYMKSLLIAFCVAGVLDFIVAILCPNAVLYAAATLVSCLIWLCINEKNFLYMKPTLRDITYIIILLSLFAILNMFENVLIRALVYIIVYFMLTLVIRKDEWKYMANILKKGTTKIMHR